MSPRTRNLTVGVVVLAALVGLAWMILQFSSRSFATMFTRSMPFQIEVDRSDGLGEGSAVQYLGVTVGRIIQIRRAPDNRGVIVDAVLNDGEVVPSNVVGIVKAQSALGSSSAVALEVVHGEQPTAQPLQANATIKAVNRGAGLIPTEFTELARSIQEQKLIQHVDETVLELKTQLVRAGDAMESFNKLIGDDKLKDDLTSTMSNIRSTSESLNRFTTKLDGLAGETDQTLKQVRTTLAGGGTRVDELSKQIGDRLTQLGDLLDKFNAIATRIDKGEGTLGLLVNDPKLYDGLVDTSKTLNLTVSDLRRLVEQWEQEGFTLKLK